MILSTFAVPIGLENLQWRFYIIFVAWVVVEFIGVYLMFPETKGPTLEDIAYIFDGSDAKASGKLEAGEGEAKIEHTHEELK